MGADPSVPWGQRRGPARGREGIGVGAGLQKERERERGWGCPARKATTARAPQARAAGHAAAVEAPRRHARKRASRLARPPWDPGVLVEPTHSRRLCTPILCAPPSMPRGDVSRLTQSPPPPRFLHSAPIPALRGGLHTPCAQHSGNLGLRLCAPHPGSPEYLMPRGRPIPCALNPLPCRGAPDSLPQHSRGKSWRAVVKEASSWSSARHLRLPCPGAGLARP